MHSLCHCYWCCCIDVWNVLIVCMLLFLNFILKVVNKRLKNARSPWPYLGQIWRLSERSKKFTMSGWTGGNLVSADADRPARRCLTLNWVSCCKQSWTPSVINSQRSSSSIDHTNHVRRRRQVLSTQQTDGCRLFISRSPTVDVPGQILELP